MKPALTETPRGPAHRAPGLTGPQRRGRCGRRNRGQLRRVSDRTGFFNLAATGRPGRLIEMDDTTKMFSNPTQKATEDYVSGRFG